MYQIIWSSTALNSYEQIWEFIFQQWSIDIVIELDDKVQDLLSKLSKQKHLCPPLEAYDNLRKCVVRKQTSLVYMIDENNKIIHIISFIDNRMKHPF